MKQFLTRHSSKIIGVVSGLDRLLIRGTLRQLVTVAGMMSYLNFRRVRLMEFADFAESITAQIRASAEQSARLQQRPFVYLPSSQTRKEEVAHDLLKKNPVDKGLICILSAVEPCLSYQVHRSRERKQIELQLGGRKCLHLYHYLLHPTFGFMHVRVQTWFPFNVQVCLNGREGLSRQLDQAGVTYQRRSNCFVHIEQPQRAQALMERQLRANWVSLLDELCQQAHPMHPQIAGEAVLPYYWAVNQMEWATDLMFDNRAALAALYPSLTRHAITHFSSAEVMRFLGRKLTSRFPGEIISDYGMRLEGLRVKHRVNGNSVKIYDKQGSVLRVETTLHQPRDLKIYRRVHGDSKSPLAWRRLVKGVSAIRVSPRVGPV